MDTPICESGFTGVGIGAAMVGLRPIVEFMTFNFSLVAIDQIVNHAAKIRYMSGGQFPIPLVFRGPGGRRTSWPRSTRSRWIVLLPRARAEGGAPDDAPRRQGVLKSAIRDDNPVIFIESETLYGVKGEVPDDAELLIPLGVAEVKREGRDVTVIAYSGMYYRCSRRRRRSRSPTASRSRSSTPAPSARWTRDDPGVGAKTHRCLVAESGAGFAGMGAEIAAYITEHAFDELDAPVARVFGADMPMPYAKNLERLKTPSKERIIDELRKLCSV